MFNYNIINKPTFSINNRYIDKIISIIHNLVNKEQNWTLNIVFLDDISIKKLNNEYRKINKTTDVLSFHYFEDFFWLNEEEIVWEIIMSEAKIKKQAKTYWLGNEWEFYKLLIHSILHILWYDHENDTDYIIMQKLENTIYNKVFD